MWRRPQKFRRIQDITVGDSSKTAKLTVRGWKKVTATGYVEWWYGNLKGRSFTENSTAERIEEIGEEEDEESNEESTTNDENCGVQLSGVCVVQVIHLNMRLQWLYKRL